jgi:hypothetical protein
VNESCSHEFDPSRTLTYLASNSITEWARKIYFYSWLYKREVSWSHTDLHLFSEYIREHRGDRELQMTDTYPSIYHYALYLIKCIVMCCVDIFISEHSSRDNCPNWCIFMPHDQILHTRCLSCEYISLAFEPECILHISSRMRLWDIYCIKIEVFSRQLHRIIDVEPHTDKCILNRSRDEGDRMQTSFISSEWHCHIFFFIF